MTQKFKSVQQNMNQQAAFSDGAESCVDKEGLEEDDMACSQCESEHADDHDHEHEH